jgi:heme exporter protein D
MIASMLLALRGKRQVRQTLARQWRLEDIAKQQAQDTASRQQSSKQTPEVNDESGT